MGDYPLVCAPLYPLCVCSRCCHIAWQVQTLFRNVKLSLSLDTLEIQIQLQIQIHCTAAQVRCTSNIRVSTKEASGTWGALVGYTGAIQDTTSDSRAVNKALNFNKLLAEARANSHQLAVIESMTFQLPRFYSVDGCRCCVTN